MKSTKTPTSRPKRGFTIIELLVVVAIIIVLAALAFLGANGARKRAEMVVTVNRIKGLSNANALYAADHGGKYVPIYTFDENRKGSVHWHFNGEFLEPLIGDDLEFLEEFEEHEGVAGLPEQVLDPIVVRAKEKYWDRISASFGYNNENMPGGSFGGANTVRGHSLGSVADSSRTYQFITCTDWIAKYSGRFLWETKGYEGKTPDGKLAYRHNGSAVVIFYDGHTELKRVGDIRALDARGGRNNVFWGGSQD